ncbi:hypothetical protein [Clostridium thermarum]|uniref:hypothetical protein n=1 Tax=Clostridium thermarum TaxID=1716543 RepID=UPI0013CFF141|nr:hypothetical protein [Clostridium thermarum]
MIKKLIPLAICVICVVSSILTGCKEEENNSSFDITTTEDVAEEISEIKVVPEELTPCDIDEYRKNDVVLESIFTNEDESYHSVTNYNLIENFKNKASKGERSKLRLVSYCVIDNESYIDWIKDISFDGHFYLYNEFFTKGRPEKYIGLDTLKLYSDFKVIDSGNTITLYLNGNPKFNSFEVTRIDKEILNQ